MSSAVLIALLVGLVAVTGTFLLGVEPAEDPATVAAESTAADDDYEIDVEGVSGVSTVEVYASGRRVTTVELSAGDEVLLIDRPESGESYVVLLAGGGSVPTIS